VNSGLPCERFCFEGFLPQKKGRNKRLILLEIETRTMVFYESPFRLVKTLDELAIHLGNDREASVSRELSKVFEENIRGSLSYLSDHFRNKPPKGEIVIVVAGKKD
jgi:16S rRNA (cytidine1402-2'-O)-methyltransferase